MSESPRPSPVAPTVLLLGPTKVHTHGSTGHPWPRPCCPHSLRVAPGAGPCSSGDPHQAASSDPRPHQALLHPLLHRDSRS